MVCWQKLQKDVFDEAAMSTQSTSSPSSDAQLMMLADAAWMHLESHSLDKISLTMVADQAGVPMGLAAALGGSVQRLVLCKMAALDRQAVLETYGDIQDAGAVSIREKIVEGLLHRFEIYTPYRGQIAMLNQSVRTHPELALRLADQLESVVRRILVMSGDPAEGMRGQIRVKGVAGVCILVGRVWMKDDSPDLAVTMKALDQRMTQAEEWGHSLRVFGGGRQQREGDADQDADLAGRYGVDND